MLQQIYSHPKSKKYPNGKPLTVHIEHVKDKALKKYFGPEEYKKYVELTAIFHDIGKINPNFQEYLFSKSKSGFEKKYKNHSYLSSVTLLALLVSNKDYFYKNFNLGLIGLIIVLIAKHHGNLPDILGKEETLNSDELERALKFFQEEKKPAIKYVESCNEYLNYFEFTFGSLNLSDFTEAIFKNTNKAIKSFAKNIPEEERLKFFLLAQYIFSCVIEADKRDAGDNDQYQLNTELSVFNSKCFSQKLKDYYDNFKNIKMTKKQESLNKVRTEIKEVCVKNVKRHVIEGERVFQIIAPTGSGKTLTFLNVAAEIKKTLSLKKYKVIYAIPFLTITDQVTNECEKIFNDNKHLIYRIDSAGKTINETSEAKQEEFSDSRDTDIDLNTQLILKDFSDHTFDHAFIVTTFVKLFETLTANRNRDLLRFNNFSNSIIIIDEIQSLPPRTYTFLIALITEYAKLFNCYVIIGSATVPVFNLPENERALIKEVSGKKVDIRKIFNEYNPPINLLANYKEIYENKAFLRYSLTYEKEQQTIQKLIQKIIKKDESTLCVLNTKRSSLELYEGLCKYKKNVFLLNTMQTLRDRRKKLKIIKEKLNKKEIVYLVSTQLIEAGIDISFPVVYRDLAPFSSIIQTAGRCNRNNEVNVGRTIIIKLINEKGKSFYSMVYDDLIDFTQNILEGLVSETDENTLLKYQLQFFTDVLEKLEFGKYNLKYSRFSDGNVTYYLQLAVQNFEYSLISQFSLIENEEFDSFSIFIIQTEEDKKDFNKLNDILSEPFDYSSRIKIQATMRKLSNRVVSIPANIKNDIGIYNLLKEREVLGLSFIDVRSDINIAYSYEKGLTICDSKNSLII